MKTKDQLTPCPSGNWKFTGHLGTRIDTFTEARLRSDFARHTIHDETVEAFRQRIDDRMEQDTGYWQGEFWGKWILSAVRACRYYEDDALRSTIRRSVGDIIDTQAPDGYIGTYHDPDFMRSIDGNRNWNVWCRKYTLWGLLSCHDLLGEEEILEAAVRLTDHLLTQLGPGQGDIIRTGKMFGLPSTSILTPVVWLYRLTGHERYLDFAEHIVDQWGQHPDGPPDLLNKGLAGDPIHTWFPNPENWAKSYEFISCVEGLLHLYRVTGTGDYLQAVENIYENILQWERSPVGSVSFNDKFVGSCRLINTVAEICDAMYWNRLSFELLRLKGEAAYADEIERTLYNTLLCAAKPDGSWTLRRLRFSHQHLPSPRHCNLQHHHCCLDNLPRGLLQAADMAVMSDADGLRCLLYNPGQGSVRTPGGQEATIRVSGEYPQTGTVRIDLQLARPERFTLSLRVPPWSNDTRISVNGEDLPTPTPGDWEQIERTWDSGDQVELELDMSVHIEKFDASMLEADSELVQWSEEKWADMRDNSPDPVPHLLTPDDALPHRDAVVFRRGPLVLARDIRLGEDDIFQSLPDSFCPEQPGRLQPVTCPDDIWQSFDLTADDTTIHLCDFSSAGNTWDKRSLFNTWQLLPKHSH